MAIDVLGIQSILFALLESKGSPITTRELKGEDSIQELSKALLKPCGQKLFSIVLVERMEKHSKQGNKESVRRTIMEHEETFRQQVHELHRLYWVQRSLMAELGCKNQNSHSKTEATQEMVQDSQCPTEISQSTCLHNAKYSAHQQLSEHWSLQECHPGPCLSLFGEESSRTQERFDTERPTDDNKSVEGGSCSCAESDLDLKLSIGPSSHPTRATHWLFSSSKGRKSSG